MKKTFLTLLISISSFIVTAPALANNSLGTKGTYVYSDHNEQIVLSFPEEGVVFYRRFKGGFEKTGEMYKAVPSESHWAPYVVDGEGTAKALICEYSNPNRTCSAIAVSKNADKNTVVWSGKSFKKTEETFSTSRFDQGPYTFDELKKIYRVRMPMLSSN